MATFEELEAQVKAQGETVRSLKKAGKVMILDDVLARARG